MNLTSVLIYVTLLNAALGWNFFCPCNITEGVSYLDFFPVGETSGLNFPVARGPVPRELHRQALAF